jgi:hypothetical protein
MSLQQRLPRYSAGKSFSTSAERTAYYNAVPSLQTALARNVNGDAGAVSEEQYRLATVSLPLTRHRQASASAW